MKVKDFKSYLNRGLGNAVIFLKENPKHTAKYFNAILYACTHNTAYDPQCECSREKYLYEIISLSNERDILEQKIVEILINTKKSNYDTSQMLMLARIFAGKGNTLAREAIYQQFLQSLKGNGGYLGSTEILELDREKGLVFIVNAVGERIMADRDYFEDESFLKNAYEIFGEEKTMNILSEEAQSKIPIQVYLETVKRYQEESNAERPKNRKNYDEIKNEISTWKKGTLIRFGVWGRKASEKEIEMAAKDLLEETDPNKLKPLMALFFSRDFPYQFDKIIELAKSRDETVSSVAFRFLKRYRNRAIHELVVELINNNVRVNPDVLDLFENNYSVSHLKYIEKVFYQDYNDFDYHGMGLSLIHIFEAHKTKKCQKIMIDLYKNGQCSSCRKWVVDILCDNRVLPDWIAKECLFDCNLEIREKVGEYLSTMG